MNKTCGNATTIINSNGCECHFKMREGDKILHRAEPKHFFDLFNFLRDAILIIGISHQTLAHFYGVSETTIRIIFTTWIMFTFHHFQAIKFKFFP